MTALTRRQQQILDFLQRFQQAQGTMPSTREIAAEFGFRSPHAVTSHLRLLRRKGVLAAPTGLARSLQLVSPLKKWRQPVRDIPVYGTIPAGYADRREQQAEGCVSVDVNSLGFKPTKNSFA
ncbi:MAG TPA: repressor LexA, partial [Verrucomicrobiae bacterium]